MWPLLEKSVHVTNDLHCEWAIVATQTMASTDETFCHGVARIAPRVVSVLAVAIDEVRRFVRWPGSVKTRFAFHIELGYTIVDLDIRYFAIHGYTVYLCGHQTARAVTELPCAVTDPRVRSPNCPVRSPIRVCSHRTAQLGKKCFY